ncbi:B3 domain-containing transcription factor VRN1-like isoform X1 [Cucumis melo]|uniref:B3 domain-containing transcription factor VRN1-like isoform X1 n=2 Tax=Cucumis melo TaxID=3656 RepID=A0A1S4E1R2_CUCME|nr:B3 domain-containing transcription factor VRN1-like isoform X1 [Cucumis melo]
MVSGAKWKVGLKKSNEKVWFEKGWEEFVKFHSIDYGHFLTFRYEGNSCFQVVIFDQTATEIEYPISFKNQFDNKKMFEEKRKSVQETLPIKRERKEVHENECVPQTLYKKMKTSDEVGANKVIWRSHELQEVEMKKNTEDLKSSDLKKGKIWSKRSSTIFAKASKFKEITTNPSFMVTMGRSYLHTSNLNIPTGFASTYLKETKDLILYVSSDDQKVWKILCVERWLYARSCQRFEMAKGWREFARDNSLKEGDICVFELMKNIQKMSLFKTTIFRFGS